MPFGSLTATPAVMRILASTVAATPKATEELHVPWFFTAETKLRPLTDRQSQAGGTAAPAGARPLLAEPVCLRPAWIVMAPPPLHVRRASLHHVRLGGKTKFGYNDCL